MWYGLGHHTVWYMVMNENCTLLGYYAVHIGNFLQTLSRNVGMKLALLAAQ